MTWEPTARTEQSQAIYAAAEQDRITRPERYRFDADQVIERAVRQSGLSAEYFSPGWESGLRVFLQSAEQDARLNAVGIRMALQSAAGRLAAGARTAHYRGEHPDVAKRELLAPIVITGGWRTGTTFLFRLLGTDQRLHAPLPSELTVPWRCTEGPQPEITAAASQLLHTLTPEMAVIHPSGPTLPEECVLGMGTDLRNWGFTSMMRLPGYADWLARQDLSGSYARYREGLQLLSAAGEGRRFVLKAPAHTAELGHVAAAFPGAVIVQIHRDIVETLTSGASLFAVYRSTYSADVDPAEVGRYQVDQSELWLRRAAEFRSGGAHHGATLVDLDYRDLVNDTAGCLEAIYTAAGMSFPANLDGFIERYHAQHPRQSAAHRYTPEDFGIDPDAVRRRFAFLSRR